jgi:hypothetical protein
MDHIKQNIDKFVKLYEIVLEYSKYELLTPKYIKSLKALIYLAGFIYNLFQLEKVEFKDEDLINYKTEIEKFHLDSIDDYKRITYDDEIHEIISSL